MEQEGISGRPQWHQCTYTCVCVCGNSRYNCRWRRAVERKLELWMSAALLWALLTSRWVKTRDNKPTRGCRVQCVGGGGGCIIAIGNLQLHRWKFISMASAIMSGHLFARPSGRSFIAEHFFFWHFWLALALTGLVDDIAGCRTLKHSSPPPFPLPHSLLDTVMRKFKVHSTAYATCGQRTADEGHWFGFGFGFAARTRF